MSDCPYFCDRFAGDSYDVFELPEIDQFFYMYDSFPVTPGHTLVIPKRHFANYEGMNESEKNEFVEAVIAVQKHLRSLDIKKLYSVIGPQIAKENINSKDFLEAVQAKLEQNSNPPDGFNHGLNDGEAAGRTVHHLHYHVMPRWHGDVTGPRGGVRHMFAGKGYYTK